MRTDVAAQRPHADNAAVKHQADPFLPIVQPRLSDCIDVDPQADPDAWRLSIPGGAGCYLLADAEDRPILLATAAGMRQVIVNRLTGAGEDDGPTRRTDYRAVVRRIRWRRTFSRFEADWTFLENARGLYPDQYRQMIRNWRAHWLHVDLDDAHPRLAAVQAPPARGLTLGPLPTAAVARHVIETLQDLFDLCRYHEVLVQAPHGQACAYKEMGKCPAPCDGTISMDVYRDQVREAVGLMRTGARAAIGRLDEQMHAASAALDFETAARVKARIDVAARLDRPELRWCRPLDEVRWLCVQRGARKHAARLFLIRGGAIRLLGQLQRRERDAQVRWVAEHLPTLLDQPATPVDRAGAERLGLVAWHMIRGDREPVVWLELNRPLDPATLADAVEAVNRDNAATPDSATPEQESQPQQEIHDPAESDD